MPFCKVADVHLHYESSGQGDSLLFIHGLGSSARDWENQVPFLAKKYRVVTPDLRGHSTSDWPSGPYSIALFASDMASLIQSLGIAPAHVVGISLGGFVAFQLALDHPNLVRSLVVVNSAPGLPRDRLGDRMRLAWALLLRRSIARYFGMRTLGRVLGKKLFPRPDQFALKRGFIERWAENDPRTYLASLAAVSGWSTEDRVGTIACPTCAISGEHDFIPLALKESYTAKLPHGELIVIPGSGHLTPVDAPERFNQALMLFLARQE